MIPSVPIVELFLAGVFAVVATEAVKWAFNIRESSIGIHSTNTGQLMKTRNATVFFTTVIFMSNIAAFLTYTAIHQNIQSTAPVNEMAVDAAIMVAGVIIVWVYLKKNHYNRSSTN